MSITLTARIKYHPSYPPKNAAKAYVARITGRVRGPKKYEREFLGTSFEAVDADDCGLYEVQHGDKKGGWTRYYYVILPHPEHGLMRSSDCEDDLPKIAKALDDGRDITDVVAADDITPPDDDTPAKFVARVMTRTQAKSRQAAVTAEEAEAAVNAEVRAKLERLRLRLNAALDRGQVELHLSLGQVSLLLSIAEVALGMPRPE